MAQSKAERATYAREYRRLNRDRINAERRARKSPADYKDGNLRKYGLTLAQYEIMWQAQKGLCAICGRPETRKMNSGTPASLAVDHNHRTDEVRGLLCSKCNVGLGQFDDNSSSLLNAVQYLSRYTNQE